MIVWLDLVGLGAIELDSPGWRKAGFFLTGLTGWTGLGAWLDAKLCFAVTYVVDWLEENSESSFWIWFD